MSKAFDLSQVGRGHGITADLGAYRNKIINGEFEIAQRGTLFNISTGTAGYTLDRWLINNQLDAAVTVQKGPLTPGQTDVPGGDSAFLGLSPGSTPSSGSLYASQLIEDVFRLAGKRVTVTAYARLPHGSTGEMYLGQIFGTGGSSAVYPESLVKVINTSERLAKVQAVFDIPTITGKILGTGHCTELAFKFDLRTPAPENSVYLAHISLVEGDATAEDDPFSPRHIQQELVLCQRYYYLLAAGTTAAAISSSSWGRLAAIKFPVTMRTIPTMMAVPTGGEISSFSRGSANGVSVVINMGNATAETALEYFIADAEL